MKERRAELCVLCVFDQRMNRVCVLSGQVTHIHQAVGNKY